MNLNFFKNSDINKEDTFKDRLIKSFRKELENYMGEQSLTVDRFEGDIAVCQNRKTGEIVNVSKIELPEGVQEGQILKFKDNCYEVDYKETEDAQKRIKAKFDGLIKK